MFKKLLFILLLFPLPYETKAAEPFACFVKTENAELFCRTVGQGEPLVVLHGGPGLTQDYLLPHLNRLAENHRVIFYDQRGCGRSIGEINEETINLKTFVEDLEAVRRAFGLERISLLGHSWGGFLAMHYAIEHPDCVEKLILSNSMPSSFEGYVLFIQEWFRRIAPFQEEIEDIHASAGFEEGDPDLIERLHRLFFRTYCYNPEKADLLQVRMTSEAAVNGAKVYGILAQTVFQSPFDLSEELRKLEIPTLIIHGDFDPVPPITAEWTHECLSDSKVILMHQCGHFPFVEDPELYFSHLQEFLNPSA